VPLERWAKIEVVVCLMWAVDVSSNISEILCILELFKVAKFVIISGLINYLKCLVMNF